MSTFELVIVGWMVAVTIGIFIFILKNKKKEQPAASEALPVVDIPPAATETVQPAVVKKDRPAGAVCEKPFISAFSKFKFWLQHWDGFWSVPLFYFLFILGLKLCERLWPGSASYEPTFIMPLFLSGAYVLGALSIAQFAIYFYFRTVKRYIWGKHRPEEQLTVNYSKDDFKNKLTPWQRIKVALFIFFVLYGSVVYFSHAMK